MGSTKPSLLVVLEKIKDGGFVRDTGDDDMDLLSLFPDDAVQRPLDCIRVELVAPRPRGSPR